MTKKSSDDRSSLCYAPRGRKVGKYVISLSNQDKVLFPKSKITKGDLVEYYERIARVKDPWKDMQKKACGLTQAWKKLDSF